MKNLMIVSLSLALSYVACAADLEVKKQSSGETSYSLQGNTHVTGTHHQRHIPAPSSWTPPERIPSPHITYVLHDQPKKLSGGLGFSGTPFSNPSFQSPSFVIPQFASPTFNSPSFTSPSFTSPTFTNPSSAPPTYASPAFNNPSFSVPGLSSY